ncbi:MAG: hypothetical protein QNJ72_25290 [Pleurocapsa sp. MO_226.B13]|nr:hypothetical protein [Pleurocapsa sp. MO_226.B13]
MATNPNERAVAIETGLKIAQTWSKNAVFMEKTALRQRIVVLTAIYWTDFSVMMICQSKRANRYSGN